MPGSNYANPYTYTWPDGSTTQIGPTEPPPNANPAWTSTDVQRKHDEAVNLWLWAIDNG